MYATCLFCNNALGTNEVLEHFPVGRRLAFDASKGRLWVICGECKRWNLSPLETRWEAIEEAEREYRNTRLRMATENIGLARLREGLELVRIGAPLRPEFAAWRYGEQFSGRYKKARLIGFGVIGVSLIPALNAVGNILGVSASTMLIPGGAAMVAMAGSLTAQRYYLWKHRSRTSLSIRDNDGALLHLTPQNIGASTIFPSGKGVDWQLTVPHVDLQPATGLPRMLGAREVAGYEHRPSIITGSAALNALAKVLPVLNGGGGNKRNVTDAVDVVSDTPDLGTMLRGGSVPKSNSNKFFRLTAEQTHIRSFPAHIRLAMEMSVHEDDERRAMEGELAELEQRWKDADAIAKIADDMFLPSQIQNDIDSMKANDTRSARTRE